MFISNFTRILTWHSAPVNPGEQVHVYPSTRSVQEAVPVALQGDGVQSSVSTLQVDPVTENDL